MPLKSQMCQTNLVCLLNTCEEHTHRRTWRIILLMKKENKRKDYRWGVMRVSWLGFKFISSTLSRVWSLYNTIDQISCLDLKYFMNTCPGGQDGGNSLRWKLHQYAVSGCCSEQQEQYDLWKSSLDSSGRESTSHIVLGFSNLQTQRMLSRFLHVTQYSTFNIRQHVHEIK